MQGYRKPGKERHHHSEIRLEKDLLGREGDLGKFQGMQTASGEAERRQLVQAKLIRIFLTVKMTGRG